MREIKFHIHLFFILMTLLNFCSYAQFQYQLIEPETTIKIGKGNYFLDFGKAYFGTIHIIAKKNQNDSLIIHLGEKSNGIHVDKSPGGTIRYQRVKVDPGIKDEITTIQLEPDQRNTNPRAIALPDSFDVLLPFRYCEIENLKIPISKIQIYQKAYHYEFNDNASYFSSSDTLLNEIWKLCKHTIKATSFTGYYIDGDRERIPYEADAYINQLSHFALDTVYSMARRTNAYFFNHPTWPTEWILHQVLLNYHEYMYTGNKRILRANYEKLKIRTLSDLAREDGLISSESRNLDSTLMKNIGFKDEREQLQDIVDWPPAQKDTGWQLATEEGERDGYDMKAINTVVNCFYYQNLKLMASIASELGYDKDNQFYTKEAQRVKNTINTKLFDSTKGVYIDGEGSNHSSLHANMFPLAFEIVPEELSKSVIEFVKSRGMACSVYGAQYLLEGLFHYNEPKYALDLITNTEGDRNWWNMIRNKSSMTWEAWDIKFKPNLDWNHAWGTAPANIISRNLWGIRPETPEYKQVIIKPQLSSLNLSKIKVPTKLGVIQCSYKAIGQTQIYEIELPETMIGVFHKKDGSIQKLNQGKNTIREIL